MSEHHSHDDAAVPHFIELPVVHSTDESVSSSPRWECDHSFGQDQQRPGERQTLVVIGINIVMMIVEISAGVMYGSMALLADGLHMASHAAALTIAAFAYIYARRHARDERFNFGTGKVNSLAGFASGVLLLLFSLSMVAECAERFFDPHDISFTESIAVAVLGLVVNLVCVFVLGEDSHAGHVHLHEHDHDHDAPHSHDHSHGHSHGHDHNLQAAYLHVLADALTSVLAIVGLLIAQHWGAIWVDAVIGLLGAILVTKWSFGLLRQAGKILLDMRGPDVLCDLIRTALEVADDKVVDLHVWSIGPGIYAVEATLLTSNVRPTSVYRSRIPNDLGLAHIHIEVHRND